MSSKNIHILVQSTLDGVGSVLVIGWAYPDASVSYTVFNGVSTSFRSKFGNKNLSAYDIVFAIDLSINSNDIPLIDKSNVICLSKNNTVSSFCKNVKVQESCTHTIYRLLSNKLDITTKQKQLLAYINDYVAGTHFFNKSTDYNILYKSVNLTQFIHLFVDGDRDFDDKQKALINLYKKEVVTYFTNIQKFKSDIKLKDGESLFIGVFANKFINEIADMILQQYSSCEIVFVYNVDNNSVLFKRGKKSNIDVSVLASHLGDGYGNQYIGYGTPTDKFLNFTKKFYPLDADQ